MKKLNENELNVNVLTLTDEVVKSIKANKPLKDFNYILHFLGYPNLYIGVDIYKRFDKVCEDTELIVKCTLLTSNDGCLDNYQNWFTKTLITKKVLEFIHQNIYYGIFDMDEINFVDISYNKKDMFTIKFYPQDTLNGSKYQSFSLEYFETWDKDIQKQTEIEDKIHKSIVSLPCNIEVYKA